MKNMLIDQVISVYGEDGSKLELHLDPGNLINIKYEVDGQDPGFIVPELLVAALKKANLLPGETNE